MFGLLARNAAAATARTTFQRLRTAPRSRCSLISFQAMSTETDPTQDTPHRPTLAEVQLLPRHVSEYSPTLLISAALHGDPDAIKERLVREVMRVDQAVWTDATQTVEEMKDTSKRCVLFCAEFVMHCILLYSPYFSVSFLEPDQSGLGLVKLPYFVGIGVGFVAAWGCLPLVFDLTTAEWFNTAYVTTEHPQPEDLETWLEVGAWTWNWMEPWTGTICFQLLALQCEFLLFLVAFFCVCGLFCCGVCAIY